MKITYKVNGKTLLESVHLPLAQGSVYLVGGIENTAYMLLGGLIAKLFPINEKLEWPQIQALIDYTDLVSHKFSKIFKR